ncbi:type II secretion system F family protein [Virgibacillus sp. W0430]|uniref:type II secretion system F family protein n=1 Tax=Virgibacillus sp. W0430 TaxID=3391580 RepID=UPI003F46C056
MILLFLITMTFFTFLFAGALTKVYRKQLVISRRITEHLSPEGSIQKKREEVTKRTHFKSIITLSNKLKVFIDKRLPQNKKNDLERRLREAGYPFKLTPVEFRLMQSIIGLLFFITVFAMISSISESPLSNLFLAGIMALLGMYFLSFYISNRTKKRRLIIEKSMPDFFDMVNLSIEAGMSLDSALLKVCRQTRGPLSEEFMDTIEDMKLGKSRREAFSDLRNRVPVPRFQSIITSLIQADMLGVGMSKVLRTLTERIREQRTQLAREQAMKAPVKMIFPMMLFIFPAIFIVLLGPLVIYLLEMVF